MILSLQGCMAVGKTTAARYLQNHAPFINISYEINSGIIEEIKRRQLNKNVHQDFLEIQRLWINKEITRYNNANKYQCSVMDFGAEEIEFYTLNYPKTIGQAWKIEQELESELTALRKCMPTRILFLDASNETLLKHKRNDTTRSRNFFEHHLTYLLPLKKEWFFGKENVDVLIVDNLTADEVGEKVKQWVKYCTEHYGQISKINFK